MNGEPDGLDVVLYRRVDRPQPDCRRMTWSELVAGLSRFRPVAGDKSTRERALGLWSPVRLVPGGRRRSADVVEVSCLVLDYDDGTDLHGALDRWQGYERLAHTTWSQRPDAPRCRLVLPLRSPVAADVWVGVYIWILAMDGGHADGQCQDPARQFYLPAVGVGGPHRAIRRTGRWLDLGDVVRRVHEQQRIDREAHERARAAGLARVQRNVITAEQRDREAARALEVDPAARERLGLALGGRVTSRTSGVVVKGVRCPACGRDSVIWFVDPTRWRGCGCEHRQSCGWSGRLWEIATS